MDKDDSSSDKGRYARNWRGHVLVIASLLVIGAVFFCYPMGSPQLVPLFIYLLVILMVSVGMLFWLAPRMHKKQSARKVPPSISPEVVQRHRLLITVIRFSEGLIVIPVLFIILLVGVGFALNMNPFPPGHPYYWIFSAFTVTTILLVCAAGLARNRHYLLNSWQDMFREFQTVNANNVSNFAFIFSAFAAHLFYKLAPFVIYLPFSGGKIVHVSPESWLIVFFILWSLTDFTISSILELNSTRSPQEPPADEPPGPYVAFDPMNPFAPKSFYQPPQNQI
jgi:hypothetical protein